jgi:hypothetical protein
MSMKDTEMYGHGLVLLGAGFRVVVVYPTGFPRGKDNTATGKEPFGRNWGTKPVTTTTLWKDVRYFADQGYEPGLGVCLGPDRAPGGGWLVDLEGDGPEAEASRAELFGGEVVDSKGWSSCRGAHQLLRCDQARMTALCDRLVPYQVKSANQPGVFHLPELPGLELRLGGWNPGGALKQLQSVVPPTPGTDGKPREWNKVDTVADAPKAFYAALEAAARARARARKSNVPPAAESVWDVEVTGGALDRVDRWLRKALANVYGEVALAPVNQRHATLMKLVYTLAGYLHYQRGFTEAELEAAMIRAADEAARERADDNPRCVRDAIAGGKASPLTLPDELHRIAVGAPSNGVNGVNGVASQSENASAGGPDDDDATPLPLPSRCWPAPPDDAAYHGLAGAIVGTFKPETESDPFALLGLVLVGFGSVVGRGPFYLVESTYHRVNENAVLAGDTALGRKGTAADRIRALLAEVDPEWAGARILGGLSSGEGLIAAVGDPTWKLHDIRDNGRVVDQQRVISEPGVEDKRLLVLETEFGGTLRALEREGNRLSALLRSAWDGSTLSTMTKVPRTATGAHISIVGHITVEELRALLSEIDAANGLANRFLWLCVRRSKCLPHGGRAVDLKPLAKRLAAALEHARSVGRMAMTPGARSLWEDEYQRLTSPPPGVLGLVTSRAAPHTIRLAMIYALLDRTALITDDHLRAALAVWDAAARSAAFIFGMRLADPKADRILAALREAPGGLTRSEIRSGVFGRNLPAERIKTALGLLLEHHLVREERDTATGGAPSLRYYANAIDAINAQSPPHPPKRR